MRRLNLKLLAALLVVVVLLAGAVYGVHRLQVRRRVAGSLRQAEQAERAGDLRVAEQALERYAAYRPQDTDALARFGLILDKRADSLEKPSERLAKRQRALLVFEQVLLRQPGRRDIRRRLVDLAMEPGLRIEGVVVREDGSPVVGAYVYGEQGEDEYSDAYAGADGRFALTGLVAGTWKLSASAPGLSTDEAGVAAVAGQHEIRVVVHR